MTEQELRELDAWIAEHVFVYRRKDGKILLPWRASDIEKGKKWCGIEMVSHYTTDPAAAMMVLEKCAEELMEFGQEYAVAIERTESGWRIVQSDEYNVPEAEAKTLPLAIAKFAQKLFSK